MPFAPNQARVWRPAPAGFVRSTRGECARSTAGHAGVEKRREKPR